MRKRSRRGKEIKGEKNKRGLGKEIKEDEGEKKKTMRRRREVEGKEQCKTRKNIVGDSTREKSTTEK